MSADLIPAAAAHLRQEAEKARKVAAVCDPMVARYWLAKAARADAVAALLAIAEKPTLSVAQIQAGWRLNLQPYLDDVAAAAGAVAAVVVPEEPT